jgi:4a-hydroxytetrahydrobiopterin dehydratase
VGINLLATPGLGTLWAGRKAAGRGQLFFSIAGFCLIVYYIFAMCFGSVDAAVSETPFVPPSAWVWQAGVGFFGIGWLWSFVSSVSIVMEARRGAGQVSRPAPPILAGEPEDPPAGPQPGASFPPRLAAGLATVPGWHQNGGVITRTFQFPDFAAAMRFVNQVAGLAEAAGHHPDIDIRWNKVTLALTTHDAGGLTEKDFALAREIDGLV